MDCWWKLSILIHSYNADMQQGNREKNGKSEPKWTDPQLSNMIIYNSTWSNLI